MNDPLALLIALLLLVLSVAVILRLMKRIRKQMDPEERRRICESTGEPCCGGTGTHCVHKKVPSAKPSTLYYDDEELDLYQGRDPNTYTPEEVRVFEEIYETLLPQERVAWRSAIHDRGIALPLSLEERGAEGEG